ncbi:hypothetical protein [Nocardia jejuensis]|uniref:hypothetical protein n=1 Tax=Nocardia jejuensis TaxID=328049 RepID=UPI00082FC088|nr:hypothetical protein [Nocardia jejuensis]
MPWYIDLLLHPASAVDLVHHIAAQYIGFSGSSLNAGSGIPGTGSGIPTGSGLSTCSPTGSVSLSGGDCSNNVGSFAN